MKTHEKEDALRALNACRNVISSIKNEDHMIGRTDLELMVINLNNTIQRLELSSIGGEEKMLDLKERSNKIDLLEAYSLFLEKNGYLDTDWRAEEPFAIDEFLKLAVPSKKGEPNMEEDLGKR